MHSTIHEWKLPRHWYNAYLLKKNKLLLDNGMKVSTKVLFLTNESNAQNN